MSSAEALKSTIIDMQDDKNLSKILEVGVESFTKPSQPDNPDFYDDKNISKEHFDKNKTFIRIEASDNLKEQITQSISILKSLEMSETSQCMNLLLRILGYEDIKTLLTEGPSSYSKICDFMHLQLYALSIAEKKSKIPFFKDCKSNLSEILKKFKDD